MAEDEARALIREVSAALAETARMIEENQALKRNLDAAAEERRARRAEIDAQHERIDELLDRLNRLLSSAPEETPDAAASRAARSRPRR